MIQGLAAVEKSASAVGGLDGFAKIAGPGISPATVNPEMSFGAALTAASESAVGKLHNAESMSLKALQGADLETREVVDAVMSAEQTLQAAVAIRDKIVSAYLEVSRMAI